MNLFLKTRRLVQKATDDDCCGVWPVQWCSNDFIFQICCRYHDIGYRDLRADYVVMTPRPHIRTMHDKVLRLDRKFYKCLDTRLYYKPWYVTCWAKPMAAGFKKIVQTFGWSIWVSNTRKLIRELK